LAREDPRVAAQEDWVMKIIAGWIVALAMIVGTGTAFALNVKSQPIPEEAV
jgi:hypothetical protein